MTDRELLELAAKAAEFIYKTVDNVLYVQRKRNPKDDWYGWNPLADDGDALRLAVKLRIDLTFHRPQVYAHKAQPSVFVGEQYLNDPDAATRRAIVKAAAEIGKEMK